MVRAGSDSIERQMGGNGQIPFMPMEAQLAAVLPDDPGWQFEPKWDGFRCLAVKRSGAVQLFGKSGKALGRFFPEVVEGLAALDADFILDGELVIPRGDELDFDALQMRLHPAESRVRRLAAETPARYVVFDLPMLDGRPLLDEAFADRRAALHTLLGRWPGHPILRLSPVTLDRQTASRWLDRAGGDLDGVVAKRTDEPYLPGERAMLKVKPIRTADCVIGGFRYGTDSRLVGSLLLGLYNGEGKLDHVGFTSGIAEADRPDITQRLEALRGGSGFTGDAPGGPSRWSTERTAAWEPLRPDLVVEVAYDQVTGSRFRHGTRLLRWRPDKAPKQCTFDQLQREARPARLLRELGA